MKLRTATRIKLLQHKMNVTDLAHGHTGLDASLIVLTISTGPTIPRVRALHYPALLQWCEAFRALWTGLHCEVPPGSMCSQPRFAGVLVLLRICKHRDETRNIVRLDVAEEDGSRDPVIQTGAGNEHGDQPSPRIHPQMPLAPLDVLAPIIPALGGPRSRWS